MSGAQIPGLEAPEEPYKPPRPAAPAPVQAPPAIDTVAPGPWTIQELGRLFEGVGPSVIRILDAKGERVADLLPSESTGGKGAERTRANAAWIIFHSPKGETT